MVMGVTVLEGVTQMTAIVVLKGLQAYIPGNMLKVLVIKWDCLTCGKTDELPQHTDHPLVDGL